jgi:hypothetical protein
VAVLSSALDVSSWSPNISLPELVVDRRSDLFRYALAPGLVEPAEVLLVDLRRLALGGTAGIDRLPG